MRTLVCTTSQACAKFKSDSFGTRSVMPLGNGMWAVFTVFA
jgi:hypothetical protein